MAKCPWCGDPYEARAWEASPIREAERSSDHPSIRGASVF